MPECWAAVKFAGFLLMDQRCGEGPPFGHYFREGDQPVIEWADAGIVLNQPSFDKFVSHIKPGGVLVVNSFIVQVSAERDDIKIIAFPASDIANELANTTLANIVCLGTLLPTLKLCSLGGIEKAMDTVVGKKKPELYEVNLAAIKKGLDATSVAV